MNRKPTDRFTTPPVGQVDLGDLRRLTPLRAPLRERGGPPIDRYYIDDFFADRGHVRIAGRVLAVGDRPYKTHPGIEHGLHDCVRQVVDYADIDAVEADTFDSVIWTPNLPAAPDLQTVLRSFHRVLRPGGVLLASIRGIGPRRQPGATYENLACLTHASAWRLFTQVFGLPNVLVETRGNVLAATALLHGITAEELSAEELEHVDPRYPIIVRITAVKAASRLLEHPQQNVGESGPPVVSIITPFLNAGDYLPDAVASVFAQSYDNWELLLVDDGSIDPSRDFALELSAKYDKRILYLEHDGHENRGISASRNLGVREARGELVAFLDADDVWLPHKLERQVALLQTNPDAGMLYNVPIYWFGWTGKPEDAARDSTPDTGFESGTLMRPPELSLRAYPLGQANSPGPSSLIVRRQLMLDLGGFDESFTGLLGAYEDQPFLAKAYLAMNVLVSNERWWRYRVHEKSISAEARRQGQYDVARRRFLEWFEAYAVNHPVPWRVRRAIQDALMKYRRPRLHRVRKQLRAVVDATSTSMRNTLAKGSAAKEETARLRRLASARERELKDQRFWLAQLEDGKAWLAGQAHKWEEIAGQRALLLDEQRTWTNQLEQGKQWLEEQWHNWQTLARVRQNEIERLTGRLAAIAAHDSSAPSGRGFQDV